MSNNFFESIFINVKLVDFYRVVFEYCQFFWYNVVLLHNLTLNIGCLMRSEAIFVPKFRFRPKILSGRVKQFYSQKYCRLLLEQESIADFFCVNSSFRRLSHLQKFEEIVSVRVEYFIKIQNCSLQHKTLLNSITDAPIRVF